SHKSSTTSRRRPVTSEVPGDPEDARQTSIPVPFAAWHALALIAEMLPSRPATPCLPQSEFKGSTRSKPDFATELAGSCKQCSKTLGQRRTRSRHRARSGAVDGDPGVGSGRKPIAIENPSPGTELSQSRQSRPSKERMQRFLSWKNRSQTRR